MLLGIIVVALVCENILIAAAEEPTEVSQTESDLMNVLFMQSDRHFVCITSQY